MKLRVQLMTAENWAHIQGWIMGCSFCLAIFGPPVRPWLAAVAVGLVGPAFWLGVPRRRARRRRDREVLDAAAQAAAEGVNEFLTKNFGSPAASVRINMTEGPAPIEGHVTCRTCGQSWPVLYKSEVSPDDREIEWVKRAKESLQAHRCGQALN